MKHWLFALVFVFAAAGLPVIAHAQDAQEKSEEQGEKPIKVTAYRGLTRVTTLDNDDARRKQKEVAQCMYGRHGAEIDRFLERSDFYQIAYEELSIDREAPYLGWSVAHCMEKALDRREVWLDMNVMQRSMRNLLAEEAYLRANEVPTRLTQDADTPIGVTRFMVSRDERMTSLAELGDCITWRDPAAADGLLRAKPTSRREERMIERLSVTFADCLEMPAGTVDMRPSLVRQVVADAMWARHRYGSDHSGTQS